MGLLSRIAGGITGSTALAIVAAGLGLWLCWIERAEKSKSWWIGAGMAVIGALGILFTIKEELASQDETAQLSGQLADSQARVAELLAVNQ
jgi:hypothetical protein